MVMGEHSVDHSIHHHRLGDACITLLLSQGPGLCLFVIVIIVVAIALQSLEQRARMLQTVQ